MMTSWPGIGILWVLQLVVWFATSFHSPPAELIQWTGPVEEVTSVVRSRVAEDEAYPPGPNTLAVSVSWPEVVPRTGELLGHLREGPASTADPGMGKTSVTPLQGH